MINYIRLVIIVLFIPFYLKAQDSVSYQQIRMVRLGVQNDLFFQDIGGRTDQDFSAGFFYQLNHPLFDTKFGRKILLGSKEFNIHDFGLIIKHLGFTPSDISRPQIDSTDRPYAGLLFGEYFDVSSNPKKELRFRSALKLGIIGPAAGMEGIQRLIHDLTGGTEPIGWESQIGNGLMLDYSFQVIKRIPPRIKWLDIMLEANGEFGTIFNEVHGGVHLRIGLMNDFFTNSIGLYNKRLTNQNLLMTRQTKRRFQAYLYFRALAIYVFYDGTVQGSLIPFEESPHTLPSSEVMETILAFNYGPVIQYGPVSLRYNIFIRAPRFYQEDVFSYGQFDLALLF